MRFSFDWHLSWQNLDWFSSDIIPWKSKQTLRNPTNAARHTSSNSHLIQTMTLTQMRSKVPWEKNKNVSREKKREPTWIRCVQLKLASAASLTLQVRHSSSNTAADWSGAAGPSPETTAGTGGGASWTAWAGRSVPAWGPRLSGNTKSTRWRVHSNQRPETDRKKNICLILLWVSGERQGPGQQTSGQRETQGHWAIDN